MRHLKRWLPILAGSSLVVALLVTIWAVGPAFAQGPGGEGRGGMMGGGAGPGWMMGNTQGFTGTAPYGFGPRHMMGGGFGPGWMMGEGFSGMMGFGMVNSNNPFYTPVEPLSLAEATEVVNDYLASLGDRNLTIGEVMVFDNHAYAQIIEQDSEIGVMEVLVDPATRTVYPEMGPNMMWNLKYGMMSGFGRYGMMRGFGFQNLPDLEAEMTVNPEQAVELAQEYLDSNGYTDLAADEHADPFYGYYTLHVNSDGETVGMLSVNGYTEQVFPHTWHGKLLEMSGE